MHYAFKNRYCSVGLSKSKGFYNSGGICCSVVTAKDIIYCCSLSFFSISKSTTCTWPHVLHTYGTHSKSFKLLLCIHTHTYTHRPLLHQHVVITSVCLACQVWCFTAALVAGSAGLLKAFSHAPHLNAARTLYLYTPALPATHVHGWACVSSTLNTRCVGCTGAHQSKHTCVGRKPAVSIGPNVKAEWRRKKKRRH